MKCDKDKSWVIDWLNNELAEKDRQAFGTHLKECTICQQELKEAQAILGSLETITIPQPSANMENRFSALLRSYKQPGNKPSVWKSLKEKIRKQTVFTPGFRLAYSIFLLAAGIFTGYLLFHRVENDRTEEKLNMLSSQVEDMRQTMVLSLLDNSSPGERLRAVSYAEEMDTMEQQVTDALFATLNEDPNVNVRLATLDVLASFGKYPQVRERLVQSIPIQESPLVQSALADIMLKFREKRAVNSFKSLLEKQELSTPVKKKIERTIQTLQI